MIGSRVLLFGAACMSLAFVSAAQEPRRQPIVVNPQPVAPRAQPAPSQQKVLVAPALHTLDANDIQAIALQSNPPDGATQQEKAAMQRVSERLRHKDRAAAEKEWVAVVESAARRDDKHKDWINLESWSHYVLHQAYLTSNKDLKYHVEKVRFYHEQKSAADERRAQLQRAQRDLGRRATPTQSVSVRSLTLTDEFEPGRRAVTLGPEEPVTAESVAKDLQRIVVLCNHAEEESRQANLDLQNALQKQQRTLQAMSNDSKMLHDTAKNMVNNIR